MGRVVIVDSVMCNCCPICVRIGEQLYCPILGCNVEKKWDCRAGTEQDKYDDKVNKELQELVEIQKEKIECLEEIEYELRDLIRDYETRVEELEEENTELKASLAIEETIKT